VAILEYENMKVC